MLRKAFTLIELLVVIAIIAILAAILFPVFAQAKMAAKKTVTLSQFKQIGTSTMIYNSDYDDTFPLAQSFNNATGKWRSLNLYAVPNGVSTNAGRNVDPRKSEEGTVVLNAIQPYVKSIDIYAAAGMPDAQSSAWTFVPGATLGKVGLSFNGLLHAYSGTAMTRPSNVPMYWMGNFAENNVGLTITSPQLACNLAAPDCKFNPSGYPSSAGAAPSNTGYGYYWFGPTRAASFTLFCYGKGMPFVSSDTSAKFKNFGNLPLWPSYSGDVNSPWSSMDPAGINGAPYWTVDCVSPGVAKHTVPYYWGWFRPDNDGSFTIANCDAGGG